MALIYIHKADGTKNKYKLPPNPAIEVQIGRNDDCLISLPDVAGLSGLHCSIKKVDDAYIITDQNSTNGIIHQSERVNEYILREGESLLLGEATLTYDAEGAPLPAALVKEKAAAEKPAPAPSSADAAPAKATPLRKKRVVKKSDESGLELRTGSSYRTRKSSSGITTYVIAVIVLSFLAGLTLRHWRDTKGFFLVDMLNAPNQKAVAEPPKAQPAPVLPPAPAPAPAKPAEPASSPLGEPA